MTYRSAVLRRGALALFTLVLLAVSGALAGPAAATSPTAPLTAVQNDDGTQSLHWELQGTSDSINILPHLRCAADPAATGVFAGSTIPCIWLVDHKAPLVAGPADCPSTGQEYASWRCDMRNYRDIVVDGAQAGESSLIMFNTKPAGGSGICASIPLALRLGAGKGTVQASDGCQERIVCAAGYGGKINADALDIVTGCKNVSKSGVTAPVGAGAGGDDSGSGGGSGSGSGSGSGGGSGFDFSKCTGAGSGKKGDSPLYSVEVKARGKRGMYVRVYMRRAVPIKVTVHMKQSRGTKVVRYAPRCAKAGANFINFPNATGGAKSRRRYRVLVQSDTRTYPLRSAYAVLPRR
jgi:hypothetical protein